MKAKWVVIFLVLGVSSVVHASQNLEHARQLEESGDGAGARSLLAHAAQDSKAGVTALMEYAQFLDFHGDAAAKEAYIKVLPALDGNAHRAERAAVARRLAELCLVAGDPGGAARYMDIARAAGADVSSPPPPVAADASARDYVEIPGPFPSFARMAAISGDSLPDDILPSLARNIVTNGYQASHSNEALEQTEYLKLVHRYLSQARELSAFAGTGGVIKIDACDSANTGDLLRILGFRMRGGCGSELVLETVNASRAFLTTDSGFPVPALEQALRTNRPFSYDYHPARVPVLFNAAYWTPSKEKDAGFVDVLIADPALCRMYLGMSKLDAETAADIRKGIPMPRLKAFAHVLDFFGGMFQVRGGKVVLPGGDRSASAWASLAGAPPDQPAAFFEKLLVRDDGWLASYFDALARVNGPVRDYLTEPARLQRFYMAIRGKVTSPGPARPVFRANADMMLLTTRLWIEPDGRPHIPGGLQVWKDLFAIHPQGKYDARLTRAAAAWKEPDDVLEALFGLTRKAVENEPLKIFLALGDLDRARRQPLSPETADLLARSYHIYGSQYALFNDAVPLSDQSIVLFMDAAESVGRIKDPLLRSDALGMMQSLVGLWQILSRQHCLPADTADETFRAVLTPFGAAHDNRALFDAGRDGIKRLLSASGAPADGSAQQHVLDLLAGAANPPDAESHSAVVQEMTRILESQHIISLDDLLEIDKQLEASGKLNAQLVNRVSARIAETPLPRASMSPLEKNALSFGYWTDRHVETERKLNLRALAERSTGEKSKDVRGALTPLLRDTLVAYNYAHYAPPAAEVLYTNPLFVRGHDFLGVQSTNRMWRSTEVFGSGWPANAGGRLVGSLVGLPYALAEAEQNFLVPDQTQALIWGDLVPQIMQSAVIPRWWNVTPAQMHWVGMHLRFGEELVAESAIDPALRRQTLDILASQMTPGRLAQIAGLLETGEITGALNKITPSELFVLAERTAANTAGAPAPLLAEIRRLAEAAPQQINYRAISAAFGTPKPTLANSYRPELLHLRTFPTLMGYSSRILAESWESNALFWAQLADETYLPPSQLNLRIPEWTEKLVEHIFASHLEDWPALLRSLRTVGDDVRAKSRVQLMASEKSNEARP